tara:strand:- start:309 stop:1376 length:1068 start_codon:yes stop_codon:yes gene_type:complete
MAQAPGYNKLMDWADHPIMPTPGAVGEMIKKISAVENISVVGVDIGGATTDVFSVFDEEFNRTVSANLGMSYSICNVLSEAGVSNVSKWVPFEIDSSNLTNRIANKMIRPTTIPQTLEDLKIEQALAREALRLSFIQHKEFAVSLKGVQQERTISDTFDQKMSGETIVDMLKLDLIVGSGGVLSHAPRRSQAMRMLIDSFLPEGITEIAVDSIFMMPQLGVLSTFHEQAAIEVFHKDCLIKLGTCLAPIGQSTLNKPLLKYSFDINDEIYEGCLKSGDIILIKADLGSHKCTINPERNIDIGFGKGQNFEGTINGGEVGIILDGRGREIQFLDDNSTRIEQILTWSQNTLEYDKE